MVRVCLILLLTVHVASADPPSGYKCGVGKPNPGVGCTCPAGTTDKRNADNHAICAPSAPPPAAASPCRKAALALHRQIKKMASDISNDIPEAKRPAFLAALTALFEKRCVQDRWPASVTTCFVRAPNEDDIEQCAKKLPKETYRALDEGFDELEHAFRKQAATTSDRPPPPGEPRPDAPKTPVAVTGSRIEITQQVFFNFNAAAIKPISYPLLDSVAGVLRASPTMRIRVDGHTDSNGNDKANLELSTARASAVRDYLIRSGIEAARIEAKGFGETSPIASNRTEADRAKNRRIEFVVLSR